MPQIVINNCAGRFVQQNSFTTPDGAFEKLLNVNCVKDQMAISRRGFDKRDDLDVFKNGNALIEYLDRIFISQESGLYIADTSLATKSAVSDPDSLWEYDVGARPYFATANGNLYATSANGVLKLESTSGSIMRAGIAKALTLKVTTSIDDGNDIFPVNSQVGYRILFGRLDANDNKNLGSPSEFTVATNSNVDNAVATSAGATTITVTSTAHGLTNGDLITTTDGKDTGGTPFTQMNRTGIAITWIDANTFSYEASATVAAATYSVDWGVEKQIQLDFPIPDDCQSTEYFYQVHRTDFTSSASVSPTESSLQLIYEANLSSAEVAAKTVSFDDDIDDIFKSGYLYTNPNTGEGIQQANDPPPFAKDLCLFNGMGIYANIRQKHRLALNFVDVVSLVGNAIRFDFSDSTNRSYTGAAVEAATDFAVTSTGTASQNVSETARSLARVINADASAKVVCYYVSQADGIPGQLVFESKSYDISFEVSATNAAISDDFQPVLPLTANGTLPSSAVIEPNGIIVSKAGEFEAAPEFNKFYAGPKTSEILRVVPLRETCLIITEVGVYGLRGDSPANLVVQLIDNTVFCKAKNSVQVINNECYFLSNQGVVACSETSARVVSHQIEALLTSVFGNTYFEQFTTSMGYESEHLYILGTLAPNTSPEEMTETPSTALIDANGFAQLTFSSEVESVVVGQSVIVSGMTGTLTPLNGTWRVSEITSADTISFWVNSAATGSASAASGSVSVIAQNEVHVYNIVTNRWSHWDKYFIDGIIQSSTDKLIILHPYLMVGVERKNYNNLDYADESTTVAIGTVAVDGLSCTVDISVSADELRCEEGDAIVVDGIVYTVESATPTNATTDTVTFRTAVNFDDGASATLYKGIEHDLITTPLTAGDVSRWKFFSEFVAAFRTQSCRNVDISFISNGASEGDASTWTSRILSGWGFLPWARFPFGLGNATNLVLTTEPSENVRVIVPKSHARASWIQARIRHQRASEAFDLQSFAYRVRAYGPRVGR